MIFCSLDVETTGLRVEHDKITEIACVLFDSVSGDIFESYATWVYSDNYPTSSKEALEVTGLSMERLKAYGASPHAALSEAVCYLTVADAVIGQNCTNFDKPLLEAQCEELKIKVPRKVWVDARIDFPYPDKITSKRPLLGRNAGLFLQPS